jgi:hypothetical protein
MNPDGSMPPPDGAMDPDGSMPPPDGGPMDASDDAEAGPTMDAGDATIQVDACVPSGSDDPTCDGIDDDCDGDIDDDYVAPTTSCGEGACATTGTLTCANGSTVDTCMAGSSADDDSTCDGVDDDCDGSIDEDYTPSATACGVGACVSSGSLVCSGGTVVNTCAPGAPSANDSTCNGIDDDCDGNVDENYATSPTACGVGACVSSGSRICSAGAVVNTCSPGSPSANDSTCNGIDDDCDGSVDENYATSPTVCGVGACASSGNRICSGGAVVNTCTPGSPSPDDNTGVPGVDDDCDGQVDEHMTCTASALQLSAGAHRDIPVSVGCTQVTVRLWGAGGAGGANVGSFDTGGPGAAGGYSMRTVTVSGSDSVDIFVGARATGCTSAGSNAGSSTYSGGDGGEGDLPFGNDGEDGQNGSAGGGGNGQAPSGAPQGGDGHYGGGGGGSGGRGTGLLSGSQGDGGGGGAARA